MPWYTSKQFPDNGAVYQISDGRLWVVYADGKPKLPCDISYPVTCDTLASLIDYPTRAAAVAASQVGN